MAANGSVEVHLRHALQATQAYTSGNHEEAMSHLAAILPVEEARTTHNQKVISFYSSPSLQTLATTFTELSATQVNNPTAIYNLATALFRLGRWGRALFVLGELLQDLSKMEEYLAIRSALLALEGGLRSKRVGGACAVKAIKFIEKTLEEMKEDERGSADATDTTDGIVPPIPTFDQLSLLCQLAKTRWKVMLKSNTASAEVEKLKTGRSGELIPILISSLYSFMQGDYNLALHQLNTLRVPPESMDQVIVLNNIGCVHLKAGKFVAATFYLNKALKSCNNMITIAEKENEAEVNGELEEKPKSKNNKGNKKAIENHRVNLQYPDIDYQTTSLIYNLALSFLYRGKLSKAFTCFKSTLQQLGNIPFVWLRLGECCIMKHLKKRKIRQNKTNVDDEPEENNEDQEDNNDESLKQFNELTPCLSYGYICFANMLPLIDNYVDDLMGNSKLETRPKKGKKKKKQQQNLKEPLKFEEGGFISEQEWKTWVDTKVLSMTALRSTALINMAWTALQLKDPTTALKLSQRALNTASELLKNQKIPLNQSQTIPLLKHQIKYLFLAHVYSAESYIMLGDYSSALESLEDFIKMIESEHDIRNGLEDQVNTPNSQKFKCILYSNLAIVHLLNRDFEEAQKCADEVIDLNPENAPGLMIQAYLSLATGKVENALSYLSHPFLSPTRSRTPEQFKF